MSNNVAEAEHSAYCLRRQSRGVLACNCATIKPSPIPWGVHTTGSHIGIKDAEGRYVFRKVVTSVSEDDYTRLAANLYHIVRCVNAVQDERPVRPEDLRTVLRTSVEGEEGDRVTLLCTMARRYPYIEGLRELAGKHHDPLGILRIETERG